MKRIWLFLGTLLFLFAASCSNDGDLLSSDDRGDGYSPSGPSGVREGSDEENGTGNRPSSGQLTCGEWNDTKNYDFYLNLFKKTEDAGVPENQRRNGFAGYIEYFGFETRYMVTVNVISDELPVGDALVELYHSEDKLFSAKTDIRGNAYLFPSYDLTGENITIKVNGNVLQQSFEYDANPIQITLENNAVKKSILDLMFVIDTTGSMGDELRYLKAEISDVINSIASDNPEYTINLALLFYRDIGDDYVTRYFDFTTNISQQQQNLARQSASGGGDFPEAVDKALSEAVNKNWNNDYATRIIFHVCDAPPHADQGNQSLYYSAIKTAAQKGIRIMPVASSGIDRATEYLLRQEAIMTGGTYIFLTDDSGIGNEHLQPTVGEYTVEYLNACMVRIVNEYLTGIETEPVSYY
ncbi:MAG: VWA domain-containing protein [Treponema sp.]|jgi:Mg-chelatase subunit ChlD|nr:VWA domain-containing protein [Treponema sp.]